MPYVSRPAPCADVCHRCVARYAAIAEWESTSAQIEMVLLWPPSKSRCGCSVVCTVLRRCIHPPASTCPRTMRRFNPFSRAVMSVVGLGLYELRAVLEPATCKITPGLNLGPPNAP